MIQNYFKLMIWENRQPKRLEMEGLIQSEYHIYTLLQIVKLQLQSFDHMLAIMYAYVNFVQLRP